VKQGIAVAEQSNKPKRRLRPAQASIRERAHAARETQPQKASRLSRIGTGLKKPFGISHSFLVRFKTMRAIGKVLKVIGRILLPMYFRNSWKEIRLVTWPNRRDSRRLTLAVLGFAIVFGALVASLDYGLSHLFQSIILGKH
jgi:preprotein translocase SecE subunit